MVKNPFVPKIHCRKIVSEPFGKSNVDSISVPVLGIVAQCGADPESRRIQCDFFFDRQNPFRDGSRFVGCDEGCASERFDGGKVPDKYFMPAETISTDSQDESNDDGKPFGNSRDKLREHECRYFVDAASLHQCDECKKGEDKNNCDQKDSGKVLHGTRKRRLGGTFLRGVRNTCNFGRFSGGHYDRGRFPAKYRRPRKEDIKALEYRCGNVRHCFGSFVARE